MFCAVFLGVACDATDVDVAVDADVDRSLESVQRHLAAILLTIQ